MSNSCKKCPDSSKRMKATGSSWLSAVLIIVIPKCPFCIMAYSSAITMCGGPDMYLQHNNWVSYIPIVLAVFIITMLLFNYRDTRTKYALLLASVGFCLVVLTHQTVLASTFYNYGTALLMFSVWLNGSLFSLLRKLKSRVFFNTKPFSQG